MPVVGLSDGVEVSAGGLHTCARRATGEVVCWGLNDHFEVGSPAAGIRSYVPVPVVGLDDAVQISAGLITTCAVRASHDVLCWGQLSVGPGMPGMGTPPLLRGVSDGVQMTVGATLVCALRASGHVICWGLGSATCARRHTPGGAADSSQVLCWGSNNSGQLGDGSTTQSTTPVLVAL